MEKNWLIRTKNNHILGPVSKAKVQELILKGSIKGDDEVCSGNGYWLYVREQDLVKKYITDSNPQDFNPVTEAETLGAISPIESDLEYPDIESITGRKESVVAHSAPEVKTPSTPTPKEVAEELNLQPDETFGTPLDDDFEESPEVLPEEDDLEYPDEPSVNSAENVVPIKASTPARKKKGSVPKLKKRKKTPVPVPEVKRDLKISVKLIYLMVVLFFIMAVIAVLKREQIMNEINKRVSISFINSAIAQDTLSENKKKSGLTSSFLKLKALSSSTV